jgi:hypothetical protein
MNWEAIGLGGGGDGGSLDSEYGGDGGSVGLEKW